MRRRLGWTLERRAFVLRASVQDLAKLERGVRLSLLWHMCLDVLCRYARWEPTDSVNVIASVSPGDESERLRVVPVTIQQARTLIARHHRFRRRQV